MRFSEQQDSLDPCALLPVRATPPELSWELRSGPAARAALLCAGAAADGSCRASSSPSGSASLPGGKCILYSRTMYAKQQIKAAHGLQTKGNPNPSVFLSERRACSWCVADALRCYTTWWARESCSRFWGGEHPLLPARCAAAFIPACAATGTAAALRSSCSLARDLS